MLLICSKFSHYFQNLAKVLPILSKSYRTDMATSRPSRIGHIYGQSDTFMAQSDAKKFAVALRAAVFTTHFQKFLAGGTILQRNAVFLSL